MRPTVAQKEISLGRVTWCDNYRVCSREKRGPPTMIWPRRIARRITRGLKTLTAAATPVNETKNRQHKKCYNGWLTAYNVLNIPGTSTHSYCAQRRVHPPTGALPVTAKIDRAPLHARVHIYTPNRRTFTKEPSTNLWDSQEARTSAIPRKSESAQQVPQIAPLRCALLNGVIAVVAEAIIRRSGE